MKLTNIVQLGNEVSPRNINRIDSALEEAGVMIDYPDIQRGMLKCQRNTSNVSTQQEVADGAFSTGRRIQFRFDPKHKIIKVGVIE